MKALKLIAIWYLAAVEKLRILWNKHGSTICAFFALNCLLGLVNFMCGGEDLLAFLYGFLFLPVVLIIAIVLSAFLVLIEEAYRAFNRKVENWVEKKPLE